jgi:hypothetical protein
MSPRIRKNRGFCQTRFGMKASFCCGSTPGSESASRTPWSMLVAREPSYSKILRGEF